MSFRWVERFNRTRELAAAGHDALLDALQDVAEDALTIANTTVPHDVGVLQASGIVESEDADEWSVIYDTEYAVVQHEDVSLRHADGRRARWLALTVEENRNKWEAYLAARLKGRLDR